MTNTEILIGNRSIAKFMNISLFYYDNKTDMIEISGKMKSLHDWAKYKYSWDWLIPVYSKIMETEFSLANNEDFDLQCQFEEAVWTNRVDLGFQAIITYLKIEK